MKKIRLKRLNEQHPGAKSIIESIYYFMEWGESELRIPREEMINAMDLFVRRYEGETFKGRVDRRSDLFRALKHMENCIDTMNDDGYIDREIYPVMKRVIIEESY